MSGKFNFEMHTDTYFEVVLREVEGKVHDVET